MLQAYRGLDKSFYGSNFKLDDFFKTNTVGTISEKRFGPITHAGLQLKSYAYVPPRFTIDYKLEIPELIKPRINK